MSSVADPHAEPELLQRLRSAVKASGVVADLATLAPDEQLLVLTNRLAQTTVRYLTSIDAVAGQHLTEALRALASPDEFDLLMQDKGYTFFHVVQFLYEFAKHHSTLPDRGYFCAGMGRGGGGVEVAPDQEVISLLRLLITALPPDADRRNLGMCVQRLWPLMLSKVFTPELFHFESSFLQENQLCTTVRYTDPDRVRQRLSAVGLEGDLGTFFLNSALHLQGTLQLGLDTFVQEPGRAVEMRVLIEDRDRKEQEEIEKSCSCTWTITWQPGICLARIAGAEEILDQGHTIYEALHRKELQYYLERIKILEMQVRALEERNRLQEVERELQTAHDLQMGLMPKILPRVKDFEIAGRCQPANHVGGDFFKYYRRPRQRLAGVLADVTGHAMEAAIPLLVFSGILAEQMELGGSLEEVIQRLNRSLCRTLTGRTLVCLVMGELDPAARTLRLVNAGCPYPYHFRAASGEIAELQLDAYPLGVRPDVVFPALEIRLDPGDRLVCCSDGIVEAQNPAGELYGFERLAETICRGCREGLSAETLLERIIGQIQVFTEGMPQKDDQTVVVVRAEEQRSSPQESRH